MGNKEKEGEASGRSAVVGHRPLAGTGTGIGEVIDMTKEFSAAAKKHKAENVPQPVDNPVDNLGKAVDKNVVYLAQPIELHSRHCQCGGHFVYTDPRPGAAELECVFRNDKNIPGARQPIVIPRGAWIAAGRPTSREDYEAQCI